MRFWHRLIKHARRPNRQSSGRSRCRPTVEGLELRELPTVTLPTPGIPGTAKITGTTNPDQLIIRLQPGSPANIQFSDNNGVSFSTAALRDVTDIAVSGLAGADTFTIDHANGFVGQTGLLRIVFDGGPGRDTLIQQGNPNLAGLNQIYLVGATSDAGRLDTSNGTISNSITFSQLNAIIDVTNAGGLTLNLNDQSNVVKVERDKGYNGLSVLKFEGVDQQSRNDPIDLVLEERPGSDRRTDSKESFVPVTLANKTTVTANGFGGDDLFTLDHSRPVSGLVSLTLDGGAGNDRVYSDNGPRGAALTLLGFEKNLPDGLDDAFLTELYVTRVKRAPAESEVDNWKNVLANGSTRQQVVMAIERAVESRTRQVRGWYEQYLARAASGGEETGWVNALTQGMTEELIIAGILGSPEFYTRAQSISTIGSQDERFLRSLYSVLMGRAPAGGEVANWLAIINNSNRGSIALTFMSSAEFRGRVIDAFYTTFLQRDADSAGRQGWVTAALNLTQVRESFAGSIEFYDLNHATASGVQLDATGRGTFTGTSANSNDKVYFLMVAPRDGTLNVEVQTTNGRFAKLRCEDANGATLFETEPRDNINAGNTQVRNGQAYYFRLRALDVNPAGFRVTVNVS